MEASVSRLKAVAISEGIYSDNLAAYPNYAITNTTVEQLYGATNVARLRSIKVEVDPTGIMELAGGFAL
jgi:FAD/FMN-containing dehydrogenase